MIHCIIYSQHSEESPVTTCKQSAAIRCCSQSNVCLSNSSNSNCLILFKAFKAHWKVIAVKRLLKSKTISRPSVDLVAFSFAVRNWPGSLRGCSLLNAHFGNRSLRWTIEFRSSQKIEFRSSKAFGPLATMSKPDHFACPISKLLNVRAWQCRVGTTSSQWKHKLNSTDLMTRTSIKLFSGFNSSKPLKTKWRRVWKANLSPETMRSFDSPVNSQLRRQSAPV